MKHNKGFSIIQNGEKTNTQGMELFGLNPNHTKKYNFQKNHCLRNQRYKNMQLYHNIVKNWGSTLWGASATINTFFFYGPQKLPHFFYHYQKK